jgi:hypothetical protein
MDVTEFGILEVKNKIKNLHPTYAQEIKKIHKNPRSPVPELTTFMNPIYSG